MDFQLGDQVELTDGVLAGEKARIVTDEEGLWYTNEPEWGEEVYIQFDRKDAHLGQDKGFAILRNRWGSVEALRKI
jgi:hypothetical protein